MVHKQHYLMALTFFLKVHNQLPLIDEDEHPITTYNFHIVICQFGCLTIDHFSYKLQLGLQFRSHPEKKHHAHNLTEIRCFLTFRSHVTTSAAMDPIVRVINMGLKPST
jgi:hypothetical protein